MSNILKGIINEAHYPEDPDEYEAMFGGRRKPKRTEPDDIPEPHDPFQDYYRKQDQAQAQYKKEVDVQYINKEGVAPNGKRYNSAFVVRSKTPQQGDNEIYKFNDAHWGAKTIVDTVKKKPDEDGEPYLTMVYYVDNHKHGYWKPWKDEQPVSKGLEFSEAMMSEGISQERLADVLCHRIEMRYPDIYQQYEYDDVYHAVDDVASFHAGAEELGSSDINIMIREVFKQLKDKSSLLDELSTEKLKQYKTAAAADAKKADSEGDYERGNKRFSGMLKATKKQFDNETKPKRESAIMKGLQNEDPEIVDENLRKWFKEKWVRFGPDGKIRGDCARGDDSEGKPKCLPQSKAHSLGKKGRASAAARKRREDPNPERSGKAINVATKKKSNEDIMEGLPRNAKEKKLYELLEFWGHFISFKTVDLGKKNAVDQNAQQEIMKMRQHYNGPVLNGMTFNEITKGDLWQNPKVIPHLLKYIYQGIPFIEERIKKFVVPNEHQRYLSAIDKIKTLYREVVAQYSGQQGVTEEQLDEKCWDTHKQVGMKKKGGEMVPDCVPKESVAEMDKSAPQPGRDGTVSHKTYGSRDNYKLGDPEKMAKQISAEKAKKDALDILKKQGVAEEKCPHCGGAMFSELMINEKKDACYYKVKSRYKVWPSAYASGALVKCRKKGSSNWGTGGKKNEGMVMGVSSDASSAGSKVQGEAANPAQQAAIAIAMKKAGKKPKGESAIMKGIVDETLGTPYPGTYEQEIAPFKRKGQEHTMKIAFEGKTNVSRRT